MERQRQRASSSPTGRGYTLERLLSVAMSCPGPFTRAELVEATGLSGPTVGFLTSQLTARGLTRDLGTAPSRGGRRPALMEFNARHGFVAGVDLGPTRTRLAIADLRGNTLAHRIIPTPVGLAPPAALRKVAGVVQELMSEAGAPADRLLMVAAGAPGVVDLDRGVVVLAPNLTGWSEVPMRTCLEEALGAPTLVENDVNLALLGEHWKGAARGHDTCAFLFVGTGVGAAVLIDGKLHRGHHFMAGEIAVMCMAPEYVNVPYGARGCLESLAGLHALAARWPAASQGDPESWLPRLFDAAASGTPRARQALDETATLLGIAAVNIGTVVDPSILLLGGALFANAAPLVQRVREIVQRISRAPVEITLAALGKEAPLTGCVLLAATAACDRLREQVRTGKIHQPPAASNHKASRRA
jgi:glucokinase